ncbi:unnamed protein product, partial [Musa textilis]
GDSRCVRRGCIARGPRLPPLHKLLRKGTGSGCPCARQPPMHEAAAPLRRWLRTAKARRSRKD